MMLTWQSDTDYDQHTITRVEESSDSYMLGLNDCGIYVEKERCAITPRKGDTVRTYPKGLGSLLRGLVIEDYVCYYRTPTEQREYQTIENIKSQYEQIVEFEAHKDEQDAKLRALPEVFQLRIARFRRNKPDFWWRNGPYELMCCADAVKIAEACPTHETLSAFTKLSWQEKKRRVPDLDDGHSGNSLGMAQRLAYHYITVPYNVVKEHGALCPMLGCVKYGCVAAEGEIA